MNDNVRPDTAKMTDPKAVIAAIRERKADDELKAPAEERAKLLAEEQRRTDRIAGRPGHVVIQTKATPSGNVAAVAADGSWTSRFDGAYVFTSAADALEAATEFGDSAAVERWCNIAAAPELGRDALMMRIDRVVELEVGPQ